MLTTSGKAALSGPGVGLTTLKERVKAMLKRMIGKLAERPRMSYEDARAALETHAHNARCYLAGRPDVEPEILYYLANDDSVVVRRLVAANPSTPQRANKILAGDADDEVRCELAQKLGRLIVEQTPSMTARSHALAVEVMERLAHDAVPRVRAILAEQIKASSQAPAHVVEVLAQDCELIVRAPILECSPLLQVPA
jgi:hypothetical protein